MIEVEKQTPDVCPECFNKSLFMDYNAGEVICKNCGLVITEKMVVNDIRRAYSPEEMKKRNQIGLPIMMSTIMSFTTMIGSINEKGVNMNSKQRIKMLRVKAWDNRLRIETAKVKNLKKAIEEINRMCSQLELPKTVKELALFFYRKFIGKTKSKNIIINATGCLLISCRMNALPYTIDDLVEASQKIKKKELIRAFINLIDVLDVKVPKGDPKLFVSRYCSRLRLSQSVISRTIELLDIARKKGYNGSDPSTTALAMIYIVGVLKGERRTQNRLAEIGHTTDVTMRSRYKKILEFIKDEIPEWESYFVEGRK